MTSLDGMAFTGRPAAVRPRWRTTVSMRSANREVAWRLLRNVVIAILLTRSVCDPIFDLTGGGSLQGAVGLGGVVNALAVAVALLLLAQRPWTAPAAVFGSWMPFLLIAGASTLYAPQFTSAARLGFGFLTYWAFFAAPFFILRTPRDMTRFLLVVLASSIAPSLYALWDIAHGLSDMADFRLASTFSHPNIFAFYLVLLLGMILYVRSSCAIRLAARWRALLTLYMPFLVVLLALTKTRSAWAACGLMFVIYAVRVDRRFLAGILLLPLLLAVDPSLMQRVTNITKPTDIESLSQLNENHQLNSLAWREALWDAAIPAIEAKPLLGHGLESFRQSTPELTPLVGPEGMDAHNLYLQIAFETGLVGELALLWLLASVAWRIGRAWRYDRDGIVVALSILGGYALESYSDNMAYYLEFNWYLWFVLGTICAWIVCEERRRRAAAPDAARARCRAVAPGTRARRPR